MAHDREITIVRVFGMMGSRTINFATFVRNPTSPYWTPIRYSCRCTMHDILEDMARVLRVSTEDITLLEESGGMTYRQ